MDNGKMTRNRYNNNSMAEVIGGISLGNSFGK